MANDFAEQQPGELPRSRGIAPFEKGLKRNEDRISIYIESGLIPTPYGMAEFELRREKEEVKYSDIIIGSNEFELKNNGEVTIKPAQNLVDRGDYRIGVFLTPQTIGKVDALNGLQCHIWVEGKNNAISLWSELTMRDIENVKEGEDQYLIFSTFMSESDAEKKKRTLFINPSQDMLDKLRFNFEQQREVK